MTKRLFFMLKDIEITFRWFKNKSLKIKNHLVLLFMRKTEVYQVRLDSQEKKQAFAVFKQLRDYPCPSSTTVL